MARYILLAVEDDDVATKLIEKLAPLTTKGVHLAGLFGWPRKFCECGHLTERQQVQQTARGARFGWSTHTLCRRPRPMPQSPRNLLPDGPKFGPYLHLNADGSPIDNYPLVEGYS